jgi:PBSX family phage portal protein
MDTEATHTGATIDLERAVDELGDRIALIKAHVLGDERVAGSNAMPWADAEQREQVFAGMGVVTPPYDPETLAILFENSSSLRQNVDAYVTNIDAFGHRFEPVIDLDASDAHHRIANALFIERQRLKRDARFADDPNVQALPAMPTPEEVAAKKAEVTEHMRIERSQLETFFDFCSIDLSFVTLRRRTRQDIEVMGNGYWEVLRDGGDDIAQFVYLPSFTMRLLPLDLELVEDEVNVKVSEIAFDTTKMGRRFRRYVQVFEQQVVYFKEFGDPRVMSRKSGAVFRSVDELVANDATDGPATEVLHFKLHNARSAYGTPRWIGNLLSVLGTRQAEEVNFLYFQNKSVPPLALLVSGGRLSAQSIPRIESYIENNIKGKRNFHRVLVIEAESPIGGNSFEHTGRMKLELKPLTSAQQSDALFQKYDERNSDKVGESFRLPRLLRGDIRDFNRSCYAADTETLTEHGWKHIDDIDEGERIAAYHLTTGSVVYVVPASRHVHEVEEELIHFVNRHVDVLVTADHRMLVRPQGDELAAWEVRAAGEIRDARFEVRAAPARHASAGAACADFRLPRHADCHYARGHTHAAVDGDAWLEFVGYFLRAGGFMAAEPPTAPYVVYLDHRKPEAFARMRACVERLDWAYSVHTAPSGCTRMVLANRCLCSWLAAHCGATVEDRRLPPGALHLGEWQLAVLLNALTLGDGHVAGKRARWREYVTSSSVLADQVQQICVHLGFRARLRTSSGSAGGPAYHLSISHRQTAALEATDVRRVRYRGRVYCFSVPGYGFFVTRRNGKVAIQGNTGDAALMFAEMQVFQPEREEFDFIINRKVLSDMGIRFWRFRSNSPVTRDPAAMAEIVRSLVNANILTPEEGRLLASDVFNREFKKISASWVKQPVALTLAGIALQPEPESTLVGPDVQKDDTTTRDLADAGGALAAAQARPGARVRGGESSDLVGEAARLIAIRNALRDAEGREAARAFESHKHAELERDVIKVPAEELASWFEKENTSP